MALILNGTTGIDFPGPIGVTEGGTGLSSPGTAGYLLTSDGTGWISAPAPVSLPTQTGNSGKYLTTDGTTASWVTINTSSISGGSLSLAGTSAAGATLRFYEDSDNGTNYVALKAPDTITADLVWTLPSTDGTNGQYLKTNGSGILSFSTVDALPSQTGNSGRLLTTDGTSASWTTVSTALAAWSGSGNITTIGAATATSLTVTGDLTVNGTTTTINSTTISVDDKNIELGSVATPTNTTADGGGITLKGTTDKTFNWVNATSAWTSSEDINLLTGKVYEINGTTVLSATALGSGVTGSSLTSVGTISSGTWQGTSVGLGYGGSGAALTAANGGIVYSTASAMAITAAGTAGQYVRSAGAAAPTWASAATIKTDLSLNNVENTAISTWAGSANITTLGTISSGTWSGTTIALNKGGTNASLTAANGGVVYSTASAMAITAAGTSGQVLTSNGAAAPTWTTITAGVTANDDTTTNATYYPAIFTAVSGSQTSAKVSSTKLYFNPSTGTLNATIFNSLSDATQKNNVTKIENATETLSKVEGVEFDWNDNGKHSAGVVAQELEKILPFLVETNDNGIKSVNYSGLIAYLIQSNKELADRVGALESK